MKGDEEYFEIAVDVARMLITITARGFWDAEIMGRFQTDLRTSIAPLSRRGSVYILADARGLPVQSQDSVSRFSDLSPDVAHLVNRVAIVTSAALVRIQVSRIEGAERRQNFATPEEALRWLFAEVPEHRVP